MIYLLYGTKNYLIDEKVKKIASKFNEFNISKYDLAIDDFSSALDDCITLSLFDDEKLVICENSDMFTGSSSKDIELIEAYLNKPNQNTTLIFTTNNEKVDERKKITKLIKKVGKIEDYNDNINPRSIVNNELKNYNIDYNTITLLIDRVGENPLILTNEINKLKLYKDDKDITKEDVLNVTIKKIDTGIFKLLDYIVSNNKNKALEMYYEMIKLNEEPIKIIVMLANQFRIMYQAKGLLKKGLSEKDIASILKIHPYRVKLAIQNGRKYSSLVLLKYISELAEMDIDIKMGKIDKNLALELFILKK